MRHRRAARSTCSRSGWPRALAAAGGALIAVIVAIQPEMGQIWTFKSFLVIVLGGAGNYPGALARRPPARPRRAARVAVPHDAGLRGRRVRPARPRAARPADRAPGRPRRREALAPGRARRRAHRARPVPVCRAPGYGVRVMLQVFMWIALAQSWNLISGLTGYVSFGHVAFFGAGAYTAAHPHREPRLALAAGRAGRRRRRRRSSRCADRLAVPAAQGPVLRDRDARAQRGAARARVVLRGAHGRRQRAVAAHARTRPCRSTTRWALIAVARHARDVRSSSPRASGSG